MPQGKSIDAKLNSNGILQAELTGQYLLKIASRENFNFDLILPSLMTRTLEIAQIISKQINYKNKINTNKNLIENDVGLISNGKTKEELKNDLFFNDFFEYNNKSNGYYRTKSNNLKNYQKI